MEFGVELGPFQLVNFTFEKCNQKVTTFLRRRKIKLRKYKNFVKWKLNDIPVKVLQFGISFHEKNVFFINPATPPHTS